MGLGGGEGAACAKGFWQENALAMSITAQCTALNDMQNSYIINIKKALGEISDCLLYRLYIRHYTLWFLYYVIILTGRSSKSSQYTRFPQEKKN